MLVFMKLAGSVLLSGLLLLSVSACTSPDASIEKSLQCLTDAGIDATVKDGAIVVTQYAGDEEVPQSVIDDCLAG